MRLEDGTRSNWESTEAHGLILAELDHLDAVDDERFLAACRDVGIDTLAGFRAFLRLASSRAALPALAWVADEPAHPGAGAGVPSDAELLAEAAAIAWWDQEPW